MSSLGQIGEDAAAQEYQRLGFKIIERNFIFRKGKQIGELDLICLKDSEIAFVEVKLRTSDKFGTAFEAIDIFKQRKLVKMAKLYMLLNPKYEGFDYHIDVAAVSIDNGKPSVTILANAIEDSY